MTYIRRSVSEQDFLKIRNFLQKTYGKGDLHNWLIDRWNFCRYFSQIMHGTYATWLETIGLWTEENDEVVSIFFRTFINGDLKWHLDERY